MAEHDARLGGGDPLKVLDARVVGKGGHDGCAHLMQNLLHPRQVAHPCRVAVGVRGDQDDRAGFPWCAMIDQVSQHRVQGDVGSAVLVSPESGTFDRDDLEPFLVWHVLAHGHGVIADYLRPAGGEYENQPGAQLPGLSDGLREKVLSAVDYLVFAQLRRQCESFRVVGVLPAEGRIDELETTLGRMGDDARAGDAESRLGRAIEGTAVVRVVAPRRCRGTILARFCHAG